MTTRATHRRAEGGRRQAHPDHRRRHGHHDPALQARRGGLPRRSALPTTPSPCKGNNDLLVLTQPQMRSPRSTTAIWRPAPTSSRTNTFNAQRISLADYGMEELAYEMNLAAAKLARAAADACDGQDAGQAALRGRRAGADQPHGLDLARRQQSGLPQRHVRRAGGGLRRAGARADRGRRRPAADRDRVRHAERQGGGLRGAAGVRRDWAWSCR